MKKKVSLEKIISATKKLSVKEVEKVKSATQIAPLELSLDFGREDLNQMVGKLQEKINEIIKKVN